MAKYFALHINKKQEIKKKKKAYFLVKKHIFQCFFDSVLDTCIAECFCNFKQNKQNKVRAEKLQRGLVCRMKLFKAARHQPPFLFA